MQQQHQRTVTLFKVSKIDAVSADIFHGGYGVEIFLRREVSEQLACQRQGFKQTLRIRNLLAIDPYAVHTYRVRRQTRRATGQVMHALFGATCHGVGVEQQ